MCEKHKEDTFMSLLNGEERDIIILSVRHTWERERREYCFCGVNTVTYNPSLAVKDRCRSQDSDFEHKNREVRGCRTVVYCYGSLGRDSQGRRSCSVYFQVTCVGTGSKVAFCEFDCIYYCCWLLCAEKVENMSCMIFWVLHK